MMPIQVYLFGYLLWVDAMRRVWFLFLFTSCSVEEIDDRTWQSAPVGLHSEALANGQSSVAQLVLEGDKVSFTLGDDRIATVGVKNEGEEKLNWQMTLDSKDDLVYILPSYDDMNWLEVREQGGEWLLLENRGSNDKIDVFANGELQSDEVQWLEFRVVNPDTGWYPFHDQNLFHPYHFTKNLKFTNLASETTTELTANLYLPELEASPLEITLTAENTEQWVIVENIGEGDLRWNIEPLLTDRSIYAIAVAHYGQDEQERFHGEGKVLIGIDTQFWQESEQQVFQFDYMGGSTVSPEAVSVTVNYIP